MAAPRVTLPNPCACCVLRACAYRLGSRWSTARGLGSAAGRREHLTSKGLGLHCDLQNEHAIVGNNISFMLMLEYGSPAQQAVWVEPLATGQKFFGFGITEPKHGSDATHMETTAVRDGGAWRINGEKTWNTGIHTAEADLIFARTSGKTGDAAGITAFLVPTAAPGFKIEEMLWTFKALGAGAPVARGRLHT